ncbi:testis-expressed protein 36 [Dryobates pubescens]|uniref:testis-expressed protein 36 n=1 Tax=Dryobates pubescens TaxID=118200 RepID=UPI0023B974A2|nr:testis-expressed protein 36 [Dryobates pubescens]
MLRQPEEAGGAVSWGAGRTSAPQRKAPPLARLSQNSQWALGREKGALANRRARVVVLAGRVVATACGATSQLRPARLASGSFVHAEAFQGQLESTTSSALKEVYSLGAAQYIEERLLPAYRAREQRAVNNNFPFSSYDNRHCLHNFGEYFDFGMGQRKAEPERGQQNSQNFQLWAHEAVPSSKDGLTIYQTSFVKNQKAEGPFYRRYPKHHSEKWCSGKHAPESEKSCGQNKSP